MKKKISEKEYLALENKIWDDFLSVAGQEEIYHAVLTSNWDSNAYLLNWLKDNPEVDKAVILSMYWLAEPYYFKQFSDRNACMKKEPWSVADFDFIEEIETKYAKGFYTKSDLACDPRNIENLEDYELLADRTIANPNMNPVREIPEIMYKKLAGKRVPPTDHHAYTEGLPNLFYDRVEKIFDEFEITY